jgi:hypothetical protein
VSVLLAGLLAVALVAGGCRGDDAGEPEATGTPVTTATPDTASPEDGTPVPEAATLDIASPRPGADVVAPMSVRYAMSGLEPPARLLVSVDDSAPVDVELRSANGEVFVEGLPEGRWDLRFQLARADGTPLDAVVVVKGVTITERGAGGGGLGY